MFNLASWIENPFVIIAFIVLFFGVIALIVFLLRKLPSLKDDVKKPMSEEEAAKENLDRILVPIEEEKKSNEENEEDEGK